MLYLKYNGKMSSLAGSMAVPAPPASNTVPTVPSFLTDDAADFVELLAGRESGSSPVSVNFCSLLVRSYNSETSLINLFFSSLGLSATKIEGVSAPVCVLVF